VNRQSLIRTGLLSVMILLGAAATAVGQAPKESRKQIEARLEQRYPDILAAKTSGKIGETWQGLVEVVRVDAKDQAAIEALIKQENADRRALYEVIAAQTSTDKVKVTVDEVGEQSGGRSYRRAKPQEYFKTREGVWIQRDDVNELKAAGKIGETWQGKVEAVKSEFASDKHVAAVVAEENRMRTARYARQARETNTTPEKVAEKAGEDAWASLTSGEHFKKRDGSWVKK
jgi:uncharacterized protein YdbL (DUF1318 family)